MMKQNEDFNSKYNSIVFNKKLVFNIRKLNLDEIFAVLVCLWIINPLSYKTIDQVIIAILGSLWMIAAYACNKKDFQKSVGNSLFAASCVYPLFLFFFSFRADVRFEKKVIIEPIIILIFLYYYRQKEEKAYFIMKSSIIYFIIISICTIIRLFFMPSIARVLASAGHESLANPLTGGFESVYCAMLLVLAMVGLIVKKMGYEDILIIVIILLFFVIKSQYVMAFLLMLIGIVLMVASKSKKTMKFFVVLMLIVLFGIITGFINLPKILYNIGNMLPDSYFRTRALSLSGFIQNLMNGIASSQSSYGKLSRFDLYKLSIETFRNHFWKGIGNMDTEMIGGHATILDEFARYGVLGGGLYIFTRTWILLGVSELIPHSKRNQYLVIIFIYFLLSCFNSAKSSDFIFILVVLIPYLYVEYSKI